MVGNRFKKLKVPNEDYIKNQKEIKDWLENKRSIPITVEFMRLHISKLRSIPPEKVPLKKIFSLYSVLKGEKDRKIEEIDVKIFKKAASYMNKKLKKISRKVGTLNPKRFFIGILDEKSNMEGGFFSKYSIGFQYLSYFSFSNLITKKTKVNKIITTLDLIRNYLHDSIHASTYRSFMKNPSAFKKNKSDLVYRYQYGLNFRTPEGKSYSVPSLTEQRKPYSINLNLLMDGLDVLVVADQTRKIWGKYSKKIKLKKTERKILNDLIDPQGKGSDKDNVNSSFNKSVSLRTHEFIVYWGFGNKEKLKNLILTAMITGKLKKIKSYFDRALPKALAREKQQFNSGSIRKRPLFNYVGNRKYYKGAWEKLFRSKDWGDSLKK